MGFSWERDGMEASRDDKSIGRPHETQRSDHQKYCIAVAHRAPLSQLVTFISFSGYRVCPPLSFLSTKTLVYIFLSIYWKYCCHYVEIQSAGGYLLVKVFAVAGKRPCSVEACLHLRLLEVGAARLVLGGGAEGQSLVRVRWLIVDKAQRVRSDERHHSHEGHENCVCTHEVVVPCHCLLLLSLLLCAWQRTPRCSQVYEESGEEELHDGEITRSQPTGRLLVPPWQKQLSKIKCI